MLCKLVRQKKVLRGVQWGMVFLGVVMLTAYPWSRTVFWLAFALVVLDALAYLAAFAYFWRKL